MKTGFSNEFVPFIDKRLKIKWDEKVGYGVFTSDLIKKGEFIEIAPVVLIEKEPEDLNLFNYIISWKKKLAIPLGWTMLYNHSDNNCCEYSMNVCDKLFAIVAIKNIEPETQLTVNYGPDWFLSRNLEKVML